MNIRQSIAAGIIALVFTQASFAAESPADRCKTLVTNFDKQIANSTSPTLAAAKALRDEGAKLCALGQYSKGISKLQQAFKMAGIK